MNERIEAERIVIRHVHRGSDGTTPIEFGPAFESVDAGDDADVVGRMVSISGAPRQEVAHYAPAAQRPGSYPADFPFVPHVESWVTRFPDGDEPTGARWRCSESEVERVVGVLGAHSRAEGWADSDSPDDWPAEAAGRLLRGTMFMRRGAVLRMLITGEAEGQWFVQLLDGPWRSGV